MRFIDRVLILAAMILFGHALVDAVRVQFLRPPPPRETAAPPGVDRSTIPFARRLPAGAEALAPISGADPLLTVGPTKARQRGQRSVGTAFAVGAAGTWLTARHVIDSCERLQLRRGDTADPVAVAYVHRSADIAVLRAPGSGPPLPVTVGPLALGEDGFAIGIAGLGGPSAVHGALIGRARVLQSGRLSGTTDVTVWAERAIVPPGERWIGGMSGGPMLTTEGAVTGLLSVASQRRGRVFMVAPEVVSEVMRENRIGFVPAGADLAAAAPQSMELVRDMLLRRRTVAQVLCTA
ncbi:MAG: trypsin-like peptidase domain-containing protein [Rhodospirillales bacterium]|nr:trypsin-like peptidase domain-containing protein [Rhodospirillales bacterium]